MTSPPPPPVGLNPIRAWKRFWFGPVSARPLGAFRIAFGLVVLAHLALLAVEPDPWLSDAGYLRGSEPRELAGPLRPSPLFWFQDPASVRVALGATAAIAVGFALGWRTRVLGVLLYLGLLSIHHRNLATCSGADIMLMAMMFYLMLSPCGAALSLDARRAARRRGGTAAEPLIVPWALRLMQLQVSILYFMTALLKARGTTWTDGTALHYVLHNTEYRRFALGLTEYPLLIHALTIGALLTEFGLAFLLWSRAARPWAILAGLGLHGGIALTVNIPIFGELMAASYLTFLTAPELDALRRAASPRAWFRRPPVEPDRRTTAPARRDGPEAPRGPHAIVSAATPHTSGTVGR